MAALRQRLHPRYLHKCGTTHHPFNAKLPRRAITALSRVMWVWLAGTQYGRGFAIVERRKFFREIFASGQSAKFCPAKISRHTVWSPHELPRSPHKFPR